MIDVVPPPMACVPDLVDPTAAARPVAVVVVTPDAVDDEPPWTEVELPAPWLVEPPAVTEELLPDVAVELLPLALVELLPLLLLPPPPAPEPNDVLPAVGSGGGVAPTPRLPWNCGLSQLDAVRVSGAWPVM